jgi:hypothetical protein
MSIDTEKEEKKLSGRALDEAVAKAIGFAPSVTWEVLNHDETASMIGFNGMGAAIKWLDEHPSQKASHHVGTWEHWPNFSESIEAAMQVEDRIAEMGLRSEYYRALVGTVASAITDRFFQMFDVVHATPEQRCLAALKAVEGK